jgi:signal peptidase I
MAQEKSVVREYLEAILVAALFLQFTNTFVLQAFYIPSGSMEKTLLVGDHLFANRFIFGASSFDWEKKLFPQREIRRGDIVVFRSVENPRIDVVKRVVAVAGDNVAMVNKKLSINGRPVDDTSYAHYEDETIHSQSYFFDPLRARDNFEVDKVPPGHVFCMGDNRDNSHDSRFWGPLPVHLVKGRALFIYWSYQGGNYEQKGVGERARDIGKTLLGFFPNTRWSRTLRVIR